MIIEAGETVIGACGTGTQLLHTLEPTDRPDVQGTVGAWWLDCPGQSPAWRHYLLSAVHLRPIEGVKPATIVVAGATHEVFLFALNQQLRPTATDPSTWQHLTPANAMEQLHLPDDDAARRLLALAAQAVVTGVMPAEPPGTGPEPWRSALIKTAAHLRGEVHAP